MNALVGTWVNEMEMAGTRVTTTQVIRADDSYQTRMVYVLPGGATQTLVHEGTVAVGKTTFRPTFQSGRTAMSGAPLAAANFAERPFTDAEAAGTRAMLDQDIGYAVDGEVLTTTVQGPAGPMTVVYKKTA